MVAHDMCDNHVLSLILDILFSFRINKGNVELGHKIGNLEVQMDVMEEDFEKISDIVFKIFLDKIKTLRSEIQKC